MANNTSYPIKLKRGQTFYEEYQFVNSSKVGLSLSGCVLVFHIREEESSEVLYSLRSDQTATSTGSKFGFLPILTGGYYLKISDEDTFSFDFDEARWWASIEKNGNVDPFGKGSLTVVNP